MNGSRDGDDLDGLLPELDDLESLPDYMGTDHAEVDPEEESPTDDE